MKLVEDFFNKLLKELDSKYFPSGKYYRDNEEDAKLHYTVELYSNGCLIYNELIRRISESCNDTKENIHIIVSKYVEDFEGFKYNPKEKTKPIRATFVSVWDGSTEIETSCKFNPETKEVTDIKSTDDVEDLDILFEEYVVLPTGEIIKDFNYDGCEVVDGQKQNEE